MSTSRARATGVSSPANSSLEVAACFVYLIKQFKQAEENELYTDRSYTVTHVLCTSEIEIEMQAIEQAQRQATSSIAELGIRARPLHALARRARDALSGSGLR